MKTSALSFISSVIAAFTVFFKFPPDSRKPIKNRSGSEKLKASRKTAAKPRNPYRAVLVISGKNPCAAVKVIGKKRCLVEGGDAPQLPLAACDAEKCACKYGHHEDRRDGDDERRTISGLRTQLHVSSGNAEQREKRGRRKSDWE
jgi:hypothetical protein